jgi:hypothetical protein
MSRIRPTDGTHVPSSKSQPTQTESSKSQTKLTQAQDSFETAPPQTSAAREILQSAKSEGKRPMTENNVNRFIHNNLKPNQYPEAFRDVKGWVSKNFTLTETQKSELNSLSKPDTQRIQQVAAEAARLNQQVTIRFVNPDKESGLPKQLVFGKIMSAGGGSNPSLSQLDDQSSTVKKDGTRVQISDDKRQDLQKQIEEQEKKAKELQEKLKEEQENVKRFNVFFGDPATRRLQDFVDDSDKKLRLK